jgi:hypothetical protein
MNRHWFNISTPHLVVRGVFLKLFNCFNRRSTDGHFWGLGFLQVGHRHLFYVGHSGVSIGFLGTTLAALFLLTSVAHAAAPAPLIDAAPDPLLGLLRLVADLVRSGQWMQVGMFLTIILVLAFQRYGRAALERFHGDEKGLFGALRSVLAFLFTTKPGGWLLNVATTIAGALAAAGLAGVPVTAAMALPIITGAAATAGIYGGLKDTWEWYQGVRTAKVLDGAEVTGNVAGAVAAAAVATPGDAAKAMDELAAGK